MVQMLKGKSKVTLKSKLNPVNKYIKIKIISDDEDQAKDGLRGYGDGLDK